MPLSPFCDTLLDDNCCVHWGAYRFFDETVHSGFTVSMMQTRVLGLGKDIWNSRPSTKRLS